MTKRLPSGTQRTGVKYWLQKGFFMFEATAFADISIDAINANKHLRQMITTRKWEMSYFKRYKQYSDYRFRKHILEKYKKYKWTTAPEGKNGLPKITSGDSGTADAFRMVDTYRKRYGSIYGKGKTKGSKPVSGGADAIKTKDFQQSQPNRNDAKRKQIVSWRNEIDALRWKLKFEKNPTMINDYKARIKRMEDSINKLSG